MTAPSLLDELEPCPFCGGKAEIERKGSARQSTIYECGSCGCRLETGEVFDIGKRWNTRYQPTLADMAKRLEAAERDSKRMDWVEDRAHALDWDPNQPMKRVIRGDDGAEFCGDTWREQIDAAAQEGEE